MATALLSKLGPAEPELQELRDVIERQTAQLARLLDDLLDVSRIASGKIVLRKDPVSLVLAVNSGIEASRPFINSQEHQLTVSLPRDCPENDARQAALAVPNVAAAMAGKTPRKVIVVANRIINVVV